MNKRELLQTLEASGTVLKTEGTCLYEVLGTVFRRFPGMSVPSVPPQVRWRPVDGCSKHSCCYVQRPSDTRPHCRVTGRVGLIADEKVVFMPLFTKNWFE